MKTRSKTSIITFLLHTERGRRHEETWIRAGYKAKDEERKQKIGYQGEGGKRGRKKERKKK